MIESSKIRFEEIGFFGLESFSRQRRNRRNRDREKRRGEKRHSKGQIRFRRKDGTADLSVDPIKGRSSMHYGSIGELLTVAGSRLILPSIILSTDRLKFYRQLFIAG